MKSTHELAETLGDPIGDKPYIDVHLRPMLAKEGFRWANFFPEAALPPETKLPPEAGFIAQLGMKSLVGDLKNQLCDKLELPHDSVVFMHEGFCMDNAKTLGENEGVVLPGPAARRSGHKLVVQFDATFELAESVRAANSKRLQSEKEERRKAEQRQKEEEAKKKAEEALKKKQQEDYERNKEKIEKEERERKEAERAAADLATKLERLNSLPREIRVVDWDPGWVNFVGDRFGEIKKLVNELVGPREEGYTLGEIIDEASFWGNTGKLIKAFSEDVLPKEPDFPIVIVFGGVPDKGPVFQRLRELQLPAVDEKTVAAHAEPKDGSTLCGVCFCDPGTVVLSSSCPASGSESKHYYCKECVAHCFDAMREVGEAQFPMYCVGCRAAWPNQQCPGGEETIGRIETQDVALLESQGIVNKELAFRVLKLHNEMLNTPMPPFMQCPGKCGRHLLLDDSSYTQQLRQGGRVGESISIGWLNNGKFVMDAMNLGQCECGASMCVKCSEPAVPGHTCTAGTLTRMTSTERSMISQAYEGKGGIKTGRQCPGCGNMVEKNEGCDDMMCGTSAHGRLRDALRNGGCACTFKWSSGEVCQAHYIDLDDQNSTVFPVNDRQIYLIGTKWHNVANRG